MTNQQGQQDQQERQRQPYGTLVAVEGIDGAGTTTQARRLVHHLRSTGRAAHLTRQPSDGSVGQQIRGILSFRERRIDRRALALLFAADRVDHLQREVVPQLALPAVVVSDRWYHSSLAYQAESGEDLYWVAEVNRHARAPDLTIFLRVRPRVAAERRVAEGRAAELFDDLVTQRRVAAMYERAIMLCAARGERVDSLDGELPVDEVHRQIVDIVEGYLARLYTTQAYPVEAPRGEG